MPVVSSPRSLLAALAAGILTVTLGVGLVESLLARLAFRRVPLLLVPFGGTP